ncbi:hypothetical protein SEPCBS119000_002396 [Sporothrix epigloea]|uniref:Transcription factor n=1 Tax=Sporothrix epigloea TaxID=1892477 RepID=A0ABP0DHM7_9PEZI
MISYTYGNSCTGLPQTTSMQQQQQQHSQSSQSPQAPQTYFMSTYHQQPSIGYLDDLSRQLASASSTIRRRHSRSSHYGNKTTGPAMRIVKPQSANNSPQSSVARQTQNRVAAFHGTSTFASPHQFTQQPLASPDYFASNSFDSSAGAVASRQARPVSWHPSSTHLVPAPLPVQQMYPSPATHLQMPVQVTPYALTADYDQYPSMQPPYALSPYAHSSQTSPSTAFSPYSGTHDYMASGHYYSPNPWTLSPSINMTGAMFDKLPSPVDFPASIAGHHQQALVGQTQNLQDLQLLAQSHNHSDTGSTAAQGFAAPRTPPDNSYFSAAEQAPTRISTQGSIIACQGQTADQQEGEILVGMGLYDPPEKEVVDPTLQNYRSSMAQLLGAAYTFPEPTGKGLKLEDAWEPPENLDDDDDSDNDQDRDAEGEDQ